MQDKESIASNFRKLAQCPVAIYAITKRENKLLF